MADNTTLNAGSGGDVIASDDIGGVKFPRTKLVHGADGVNGGDVARTNPLPVDIFAEANALYRGRACSFRTQGAAGTTGQKLLTLFNAAAGSRIITINQVTVDLYQTVVKAVGTPPPIIRVHRLVAAPTGGTALTKTQKDTALIADANVTVLGATASDGGALTAIAATAGAMLTQEFAPRLITAAGYEMFDRTELLSGWDVVVRPGEGILVNLDYSATGQNPASDMWIVTIDWLETQ